jgi:hypothetical protein
MEGKAPFSIRLEPAIRAALERAAKDDARTVSSLVQKIIADWLKARKYLK